MTLDFGKLLFPRLQPDQRRRLYGPRHLDHRHGPTGLLQRPRTDLATGLEVELRVSPQARGRASGHEAAGEAGRQGLVSDFSLFGSYVDNYSR